MQAASRKKVIKLERSPSQKRFRNEMSGERFEITIFSARFFPVPNVFFYVLWHFEMRTQNLISFFIGIDTCNDHKSELFQPVKHAQTRATFGES